jgi:hypothetical protein
MLTSEKLISTPDREKMCILTSPIGSLDFRNTWWYGYILNIFFSSFSYIFSTKSHQFQHNPQEHTLNRENKPVFNLIFTKHQILSKVSKAH